jgi:glycerol-1-phosphatase
VNPTSLADTNGRPLLETLEALLVDIDGVVVLGDRLIPGAPQALAGARRTGLPIAFVTNNAAREPAELVDRLRAIGADATPEEVVTAAQAAAARLAATLPAGAPVLVVGGPALHTAVRGCGLTEVASAADRPVAVVQGWGPDVGWRDLAEVTVAVRGGARWVATNLDRTLPTPRGALPGSGALIAAVDAALGRQPDEVVGKPGPALFDVARDRVGAPARLLMVGDRLDTDIAGAAATGIPGLLVLTGVSGPKDLLAAQPTARPAYVGADLSALALPHPGVHLDGHTATCRAVTLSAEPGGSVRREQAREASGAGPLDRSDGLDGLRAAATLAWSGVLRPDRYAEALACLDLR